MAVGSYDCITSSHVFGWFLTVIVEMTGYVQWQRCIVLVGLIVMGISIPTVGSTSECIDTCLLCFVFNPIDPCWYASVGYAWAKFHGPLVQLWMKREPFFVIHCGCVPTPPGRLRYGSSSYSYGVIIPKSQLFMVGKSSQTVGKSSQTVG